MKTVKRFLAVVAIALVTVTGVTAQEEATESSWSTGLDIYSSYIWRGSKFGTGAAIQPYVDYTIGGFSVGGWGRTPNLPALLQQASAYLIFPSARALAMMSVAQVRGRNHLFADTLVSSSWITYIENR